MTNYIEKEQRIWDYIQNTYPKHKLSLGELHQLIIDSKDHINKSESNFDEALIEAVKCSINKKTNELIWELS